MRQIENHKREGRSLRWRGPAFMLSFGLSVLAFLIAIDRPQWFDRYLSHDVAVAARADDRGERHGPK